MTRDQAQAELEQARQEVAALRDLLAAVVQAKLPEVAQDAGMADWEKRDYEGARRLDHVTCWADVSRGTSYGPAGPDVIRARAREIREFYRKPLRYATKDAAPSLESGATVS